MDYNSKSQLRAFAAQNGTIVGLLWMACFALCVVCIRFNQPIPGLVGEFLGFISPVVAVRLGRSYGRQTEEGQLSFGKAVRYSLLVYGYAALLLAMGQFIYFYLIDPGKQLFQVGVFSEQMNAVIATFQERYPSEDVTGAFDEIFALSPIEITLQMLWTNFMLGFILTLPTALFTMNRPDKDKN
jgi:hypothetical protein